MSQALEEQLRANPDDAAAWLVYGDWLLEQGDARGALIRAPRRVTTQEAKAWRGAIPTAVVTRWLHGFVVAIELPFDANTPRTLAAILGDPQSRLVGALCLRMPRYRGDDEKFHVAPLTSEPMKSTSESILAMDFRQFRSLALQHVELGEDGVVALAARAGTLVSLDLRYGSLRDAGIDRLVESSLLDGVRALYLQRNGITAAGVRRLAECPKLASLEKLDLRYNMVGAEGARAIASSPHVGRLAKLQVYTDEIGPEGVRALAASPTIPLAARRIWCART